jgi:hypothetical protein
MLYLPPLNGELFYLLVFAAFCRGALPERQWMKVPEVFLYLPPK